MALTTKDRIQIGSEIVASFINKQLADARINKQLNPDKITAVMMNELNRSHDEYRNAALAKLNDVDKKALDLEK